VGAYATAVLDTPLPWTRMRHVYRLLGLVRRYGAPRVEEACRRALDAEAIDVGPVSRMLERATERTSPSEARQPASWRVASPATPLSSRSDNRR
jgi:hypothetical protein